MSRRVLVAMSGGVDSSVAAALLVESGVEAVGATMKLLPRAESGFGCCGSPADVDDAKRVCAQLGIPHYTADLAGAFESEVIRRYLADYQEGRTPNPCVECNRSLKFGHLLALAGAWGCDAVATGHYARVEGGRLFMSFDRAKDQTYFLYALTARELARTLFPLGAMTKPEVRAKARALGLRVAEKPESMETCFVPGRDPRAFVASRAGEDAPGLRPGPIRDESGRELGRHRGLAAYTVGQRAGVAGAAEPLFVHALDAASNEVIVGGREGLMSRWIEIGAVSWTAAAPSAPLRARVRVRHRHEPAPCLLTPTPDGVRADFDEPQRAPAPGQAAAFYHGDEVLGGGTILRGGRA